MTTTLVHAASSTSVEDKSGDKITVQGQTLTGWIISLGPKEIEFTTIYGEGELSIQYNDIEKLISQRKYVIFYGDDQLARGRLLGIEGGALLVGIEEGSAQRVPVKHIVTGVSEELYEKSLWTRLRTNYRYWRSSFDLGYTFETGAVDKNKIETGLNLRRSRKPTRFVFDFRYAYEIEKKKDNSEQTTKDELVTFLFGAYDFKRPLFVFARPAFEFDKPRNIEHRWYPAAGIGYRVVEEEQKETFLQIPVGIGYVDEDFGSIGTNSFVSLYLGLSGSYNFGKGIILAGGMLYMPKISDPGDNWLFRAVLEFTVPIFDPFAVKLRLTNTNDNNPTPEVGNNKFTAALLGSLVF